MKVKNLKKGALFRMKIYPYDFVLIAKQPTIKLSGCYARLYNVTQNILYDFENFIDPPGLNLSESTYWEFF